MRIKIILLSLVLGTVHFGLSMLAIANGFMIFRGPSTAGEIFWDRAMNVMLFPANVLIRGWGSQLEQTLAIIANSLAWGSDHPHPAQ